MQINSPAENRIIVELSAQDMRELDITYEEMDYSTIETRRVIWTVLDAAGKALGREFDPSKKMVIEAVPLPSGGCTLCFTLPENPCLRSKKSLLKKQICSVICDFDSLDNLYSAAESFAALSVSAESSLFENSGIYRLIVESRFDIASLSRFFGEFGNCRKSTPLEEEFTREHWHMLAESDALNTVYRQ